MFQSFFSGSFSCSDRRLFLETSYGSFFLVSFLRALFFLAGITIFALFSIRLVFYLKPIGYSVSFWKIQAFVVCESIL